MKKTTFFKSLLLTFGLFLANFSVFADTYTYTVTASQWTAVGAATLNSVSWNLAATWKTGTVYFGYDATKGQQIGSSTNYATAASLTTAGISGTITSIKINTSGASSTNAAVGVSVGSTSFLNGSASSSALTSSAADYTFTGSASGSIVISWSQTSAKALYLKSIEVTYTTAPACTASNLAFAQPTMNKLLADGAFTQTATSLNGTTAIAYTSSNTGVATVNETTGEVSIVGAGSTIITASQAAGTHNAVDYCAAITTYTVNVAAAAPTITVTEITVPDMIAYVGESDTETMNVSGINLTEGIALAISGANANQFTLSTNSVSQTGGTAANTVVSVYYNPTTTGTHTATLTISSAGATSVTRTLTGTASWAPLAVPVATDATGITNTGFIANWNVVAGATEYQLDVTGLTTGGAMAPILSENFIGFTAGSANASADATDKSTALDGLTQTTGWTGAKVYQAGGVTKLGSSSVLGYLVTPSINLSGSFNVSFKAMAWSGDSTKVKIYLNDVLVKTVSGLTNDANYTLNPFSVDLTGGIAGSKIKFEGNQAAKGRLFLDDIVISSGGGVSEQPISGSPFTVTGDNSKSLTGLTAGATYKYTVTAKNANVTSAVSNQISVTTTTGTGLGQLKDEFTVYTRNGNILLTTEAGNAIEVYNAVGQKLLTRTSVDGLNTIAISYKGVALIKVGNHVAKLIL